jgi:signal transduction histidine kinase
MEKFPALGLRTRIVLALAIVMALFIVLTELSVSQLVRVAMSRQPAVVDHPEKPDEPSISLEQDLLRLRRLVAFYMITGAVIALLAGSIAVNRLAVRPLRKITKAVEQVAGGDLETKVPTAGSNELVRLSVAFNKMTSTLKEQRMELKNKLEQLERSSKNLKETQDRLIQAAKLASVGTLAAGVAHEIGNPLAGVLGLLDALDEEADSETAKRYRDLMRNEIQRIDRIIGDLLVYARPTEHDPSVNVSSNFEDVANHVITLLGAQKLFDRVEVDLVISAGPLSVAISHDDLTQVLINLLLNAAQAMDGTGHIVFDAAAISNWRPGLAVISRDAVRIQITDSGPGVPEEHAGAIFDPFFSKKEAGQGFGLGLAICQSICNRAGGEIALDREYKDGSRFIVTLLRT